MIFHYAGKYSGAEADLPQRDPMPKGAVQFREPELSRMAVIANLLALGIILLLLVLIALRAGLSSFGSGAALAGMVLAIVAMVPHELLHAIWFQKDVYMYTNLRQSLLFVVGTEDMSRGRFVLLSLFPALVLGAVPFLVFLINPSLAALGWFGAMGLASAAGDFINVFNALTQVPADAQVFLSGTHSFWYQP